MNNQTLLALSSDPRDPDGAFPPRTASSGVCDDIVPRKITKRDCTTIYLFTSTYCKVQLFAYILIRHPAKLPNEIMNNIKDTTCTSNDVPTKIATSFLDIRL